MATANLKQKNNRCIVGTTPQQPNISFKKFADVPTLAPKSSSYFFEICVPYNSHFVGDLKRGIPAYAREWHADIRIWVAHRRYREFVCGLIDHHFGVAPIVTLGADCLERLVVLP